jgi:hypothetical protein
MTVGSAVQKTLSVLCILMLNMVCTVFVRTGIIVSHVTGKRGLWMCENTLQGKVFVSKENEETGNWWNLVN